MPKSRFGIVDSEANEDKWFLGEIRGQSPEVDSFSPVTFLQTPAFDGRSEVAVDDAEHKTRTSSRHPIFRLFKTMGDDALSRGPLAAVLENARCSYFGSVTPSICRSLSNSTTVPLESFPIYLQGSDIITVL